MLFSWVSLSCMYFQACLLLKYCLSVVCACNPSIWNSSLFSLISPGFLSWSFLSLLVYLFFWLQMTPFLWDFFFFFWGSSLRAEIKVRFSREDFHFLFPNARNASSPKILQIKSVAWVFLDHPDSVILWVSWLVIQILNGIGKDANLTSYCFWRKIISHRHHSC